MPDNNKKLWGIDGFRADNYVRADNLESADSQRIIIPLAQWLTLVDTMKPERRSKTGIFIPSGEDIRPVLSFLEFIPVIALDFPDFSDGRSYSKAVQLKKSHNYKGESRAVGNILIDQVSCMMRCGFDTLEVTHPLTISRLEKYSGDIFPGFYQPGERLAQASPKRIWLPCK